MPSWDWLQDRRRTLQDYAAARGWALDARAYVEFSELTLSGDGPDPPGPRVIRMRMSEDDSTEIANK